MRVMANPSTTRALRIGEVARLAGVSPDAIRFYQRKGLLVAPPRSSSGYRLFSAEALTRLQLIRGALLIGFSIGDLAVILRERDRGGAPCRRVREIAGDKLRDIDSRIGELQTVRRELRKALAVWDKTLQATGRGKQARLLETFSSSRAVSAVANRRTKRRIQHDKHAI